MTKRHDSQKASSTQAASWALLYGAQLPRPPFRETQCEARLLVWLSDVRCLCFPERALRNSQMAAIVADVVPSRSRCRAMLQGTSPKSAEVCAGTKKSPLCAERDPHLRTPVTSRALDPNAAFPTTTSTKRRGRQGSIRRGGGGGWDPEDCVPKMARQNFPHRKFGFPPLKSLWSGKGGGFGMTPWCDDLVCSGHGV